MESKKLPGVTFYVEASELKSGRGAVQLGAAVSDVELWDQVLKKLDGFRVYTVSDIHTAMYEVLSQDNMEQKEAYEKELGRLRAALERSEQRLSILEYRERQYRELEQDIKLAALSLPLPPVRV